MTAIWKLKPVRISGIIMMFGFGMIQLIPVYRTNPPVISDCDAPPDVKLILKRSCYDCHSYETIWPFYSYIAPVSWLVARDVDKGRKELNFSDWQEFRNDGKIRNEILEEIDKGEMPLPMYVMAHPEAKLSETNIAVIRQWIGPFETRRRDHDHNSND